MKVALAILALAASFASLQTNAASNSPSPPADAKPLAFEDVTIKPSHAPGWNMYPTPDGYHAMGVSLRQLVREAYGVFDTDLLVGGPSWIDNDKFDVEAKFDPADAPNAKDLTYRQRADMLRAVLADRFQLKVHFEKKDFPTYDLVVAKGGPKLTETPSDKVLKTLTGPSCLHRRSSAGMFLMEGCSAGALADDLSYDAGRKVINRTNLTARYTIELHWTPDNTPTDSPLAGGPSIFTAVQEQLGLKLEPSTASLDVLVIDSVDRPSEN